MTPGEKLIELSKMLRQDVSETAAEALEALDNGRVEYARSLLLVLVATDRNYRGRYAPELTVNRAALRAERAAE